MRSSIYSRWLLLALLCWTPPSGAHAPDEKYGLMDHHNQPFHFKTLQGKVTLLAFGFTHCPYVCPMEMARMKLSLDQVDSQQVGGLFITVDPARDTPEVMKTYVRKFHSKIIGLTGSQSEIDKVKNDYKVKAIQQMQHDGAYNVDHTANLFVLDKSGKVYAAVPPGFPPEHIVKLINELLK